MASIPNIDFARYIADMTGYEAKTTFWSDFRLAEAFGAKSIRDTYNNAFKSWKCNIEFLTELVLVLNHKIWFFYELNQRQADPVYDTYARLYDQLWKECDEWCITHLEGEELRYYTSTLD